MGGFLGGLAAGIGGAGQAAQQYSQQVRGFLEARRETMAGQLMNMAQQEPDAQRRAEYLSHASDLWSGKDMGKVLPAVVKTLQGHQQNDQALAQATGGVPQQPKTQPGPITQAGQTPGTTTTQLGSAAQPGMSLVQPGAPMSHAQQAYQQFANDPNFNTPAGFQRVQPALAAAVGQASELDRMEQLSAYKLQQLESLRDKTGQIPMDMETLLKAGAMGINIPSGAMIPRVMSRDVLGKNAPADAVTLDGSPRDPEGHYDIHMNMMGQLMLTPRTPSSTAIVTNPDGSIRVVDKSVLGNVPGAVTNSMALQHLITLPSGHQVFMSPAGAQAGSAGIPTPGFSTAFAPDVSTGPMPIQTVDAAGNPVTQIVQATRVRQRQPMGEAPPAATSPVALTPAGTQPPGATPLPAPYTPPRAGISAGGPMFQKTSENQLTAAGQKDLEDIGAVLRQIKDIKAQMVARGMDKDDSHDYLPDYGKSRILGYNSPNKDLYTALQMTDLRSAASVLRGTGSRAQGVLNKALAHTPRLGIDTPKSWYGSLNMMEQILNDGWDQVNESMKKSGVVNPVSPTKRGGISPEEQQKIDEMLKSIK